MGSKFPFGLVRIAFAAISRLGCVSLLFLLTSPLFAQNSFAVTANAGDGSLGSLGWAVTSLNNSMASGDITISGSASDIALTQALAPVSQSVTFQGPSIGIVAQDDTLSQLFFQQGFSLDSGTTLSFTNNANLGSGLDTAVTASSFSLSADSSYQQTGGAGVSDISGNGNGGVVSMTVGTLSLNPGSQGFLLGGAGANEASQAGSGGYVLLNAGSMGVSGAGTTLSLLGGAGGAVTASIPGPAQDGSGGAVSLIGSSLSVDSQALVSMAGGNSGGGPLSLVVNGGNGGSAYLSLGTLSLTNGGGMSVSGGGGGAGSYSSGSGGGLFVTVGSITQGSGTSFNLTGGAGGGNQAGGTVNFLEGSQTLAAGATFTLTGGAGGSGGVTGGNGGQVNFQSQALTLASGSLWQAGDGAGGAGVSASGADGSAAVFVHDLEGSGTVSMSGAGPSTLGMANGNFSGAIQGTEIVEVTDFGSVTLTGNNTYSGGTLVSTSTLAVNSDSNLGTGNITLDNGTLEAGNFSTSKGISLTSNGGTFNVLNAGDAVSLNGVISGSGGLQLTGGGFYTLSAVDTYAGPTTVANGTLDLPGGAQIAGSVTIANPGFLVGNGSILGTTVNNGTVISGNFSSPGTLTVGGYIQGSAGELETEVSPTQTNLLSVSGGATLDGSLAVSQTGGSYGGVSYHYIVLSAGSLTGVFTATQDNLTANWATFLDYGANAVTLVLYRNNVDFGVWAAGADQMAVAQALNAAVSTGNGNLATKLNELYLLPSGQGTALGQMTGSLYTALPGILLDNLQFEDSLLFDRLDGATGAGMPGAQAAVAGGILSAEVQGPAGNAAGLANPAVRGLWLENTDSTGSVNGDSNVGAFNKSNYGFLAGYDMELSKGFVGGVMGGYTHTDITSSDASAKAGVDEIQFGVYGNKRLGGFELGLAAAYGVDHFKDNRTIAIGSDVSQVAGAYDGSQIQAALQGDYPLVLSGYTVKPLVGLQYAHLSENAFTETGSDSLALGIPAQGYDSLRPYLGLEGTKYFALDQDLGVLPRVNLSVSQELANAAASVQTSLNGAPGSPFAVTGIDPSATMIGLEAGLKLVFGKQFNLFANYQGHFSGTENLNTFNGGLDLAF